MLIKMNTINWVLLIDLQEHYPLKILEWLIYYNYIVFYRTLIYNNGRLQYTKPKRIRNNGLFIE